MTGLMLRFALVGMCCLAFGNLPLIAADPAAAVDIRSEDGQVVIAADLIRSYDWATHTLTLAPKVRSELAERLRKDRSIVSGIPFAVAVGGEVIYKGQFTSTLSSKSFSLPVIVVDSPTEDSKLGTDQIQIQPGYPSSKFFKGEDPRADKRIRDALVATGKLAKTATEHTDWIARSLREMQTIKVGMTRAELLKVFSEEGGLSNRLQRRYAYRDCPYIKVDVKFEAVGAPDDNLTEHPKDKITQISQPFLEWSIED